MNHATTCKFCKKPLVISVDDNYAQVGDPFKILPMATCNRCEDMREKKRTLEEAIAKVCFQLKAFSDKITADQIAKSKASLEGLTRAYSRMVAKYLNATYPAWDIECVNLLVSQPTHWPKIVGQLWKMYK